MQAITRMPEGKLVTVATVDYKKRYSAAIGINYTRVIEMSHQQSGNGALLATFECVPADPAERPGYPLYRSDDGGNSWRCITIIREEWDETLRSVWNPFLFELPVALGDMPEGTILCGACSLDQARTRSDLRLYKSCNGGYRWEQISSIASGGGITTGVWEPFFLILPDGRLACYYSDSTDEPHYSQKMVMRISVDGVHWGEVKDVVALESQELRPGMGTVALMNDGRYIMTYEICNANNPHCGNPVHYRYSRDGVDWGDPRDPGMKLIICQGEENQAVAGSSPYLAYCPTYGEKGLLLCTVGFQTPGQERGNIVYVNDDLGNQHAWRPYFLPVEYKNPRGGYSRAVFVTADGENVYFANDIPDENSEMGYHKMVLLRMQAKHISY